VRQFGQLVELHTHDRRAADHVPQHALVQDVPEHRRILALEDLLALEAALTARSMAALTSRGLHVSLFQNKPECCPFGHQIRPGKAQLSSTPSIWEAAGCNRGMEHIQVACNSCYNQLRRTVFYEPPHDNGHRKRPTPGRFRTRVITAATGLEARTRAAIIPTAWLVSL
jgi:hypothetical protein